jgi:hypothetical protein
VFVDSLGRVWISELATLRVHAFEAMGAPLFERLPDPRHFRPYRPVEWLSVLDDGSLFVCADRAIASFEPAGALGPRTVIGDVLPPRWWFLPSSRARWEVQASWSIRLVDAEGRVQFSTERAPDGRWLEGLSLSTMDVDGTLAVLDEPIGPARDPAQRLHVLAPNGEPVHSVRLTRKVETWLQGALALRDGRLALIVEDGVLFLRARDGCPLGLAPLPAELRQPAFQFFSPDGRELWVFPHMRAEMWRFQVPW